MALSALCAWLATATALGQPAPGLDLHWQAPVGCPQQSDVRDRFRKLTGTTSSTTGQLQADGAITQTDSARFHLRLIVHSGKLVGERNLDSSSCVDLAGAAAVTLALLMRSEAPLNEQDIRGPQQPSTATSNAAPPGGAASETAERTEPEKPITNDAHEPSPASPDARSPGPSETSPRPWRVVLQAPRAALSIGPLPQPSWALAFGTGANYKRWRFLLEGADWKQQHVPAQNFPGYGADVDRATAGLRTCRAERFSAFEVAPCLLLSLEHISARGTGAHIAPRSEQVTFLGVGAGVRAGVYLARWFGLFVGVDAQIETARPRISIDGVGAVGELGPATLTATVGPEWIL